MLIKEKKLKTLVAHLSWDTEDDTMAGLYRIKYISLMTQLDGNTKAFVIASDTFTIR